MSDDVVDRAKAMLEWAKPEPLAIHLASAYEIISTIDGLVTEVEAARAGMRPMTEVESNLMTQVLDLRREVARLKARDLERLREENRELKTRVEELEAALENSVDLDDLADAVGKGCTK